MGEKLICTEVDDEDHELDDINAFYSRNFDLIKKINCAAYLPFLVISIVALVLLGVQVHEVEGDMNRLENDAEDGLFESIAYALAFIVWGVLVSILMSIVVFGPLFFLMAILLMINSKYSPERKTSLGVIILLLISTSILTSGAIAGIILIGDNEDFPVSTVRFLFMFTFIGGFAFIFHLISLIHSIVLVRKKRKEIGSINMRSLQGLMEL
ncbi:MAG: hypothetical protein ACMUHU_00940 [Thermoplasmatota archaeon]